MISSSWDIKQINIKTFSINIIVTGNKSWVVEFLWTPSATLLNSSKPLISELDLGVHGIEIHKLCYLMYQTNFLWTQLYVCNYLFTFFVFDDLDQSDADLIFFPIGNWFKSLWKLKPIWKLLFRNSWGKEVIWKRHLP